MDHSGLEVRTEKLVQSVNALIERIQGVRTFDASAEIQTYCDDLVADVVVTVESGMKHLRRVEEYLLNQIEQYRFERLTAIAKDEGNADGKCQSLEQLKHSAESVMKSVDFMQANIDEIVAEGYEDCVYSRAIDHLVEQDRVVARIMSEARKLTFGSRFVRFKSDDLFSLGFSNLGVLEFSAEDPAAINPTKSTVVAFAQNPISIDTKRKGMNNVMVLPNGNIATARFDENIKIWSHVDGKMVDEIPIFAVYLCCIGADFLAVGTKQGDIYVVHLATKSTVRTLKGHKTGIEAMIALPDGYLASCSHDGRLKLWSQQANTPVFSYDDEKREPGFTPFSLLSNGFLVWSSTDLEDSVIRVINPRLRRLEVKMKIAKPCLKGMATLPDDRVALSFDYSIRIYDVVRQSLEKEICLEERLMDARCLMVLPNGHLFVGCTGSEETGHEQRLTIWNPDNGKLVVEYSTGHRDILWSAFFSHDCRRIVSASFGTKIRSYELIFSE